MSDKVTPGPVNEDRNIREAVCIHTRKIFDSSKSKDCEEDLRIYPTACSQEVLDRAVSVKAGTARLLCAGVDVQPVNFNRGFFTVDVRYYYQITAEACVGAARPVEVSGLAVFDKRAILFGSEGGAKMFTSAQEENSCCRNAAEGLPLAVVEAADPKQICKMSWASMKWRPSSLHILFVCVTDRNHTEYGLRRARQSHLQPEKCCYPLRYPWTGFQAGSLHLRGGPDLRSRSGSRRSWPSE